MAALASCQAQRVLMAALVVVCVSSDAFLAQQYVPSLCVYTAVCVAGQKRGSMARLCERSPSY